MHAFLSKRDGNISGQGRLGGEDNGDTRTRTGVGQGTTDCDGSMSYCPEGPVMSCSVIGRDMETFPDLSHVLASSVVPVPLSAIGHRTVPCPTSPVLPKNFEFLHF